MKHTQHRGNCLFMFEKWEGETEKNTQIQILRSKLFVCLCFIFAVYHCWRLHGVYHFEVFYKNATLVHVINYVCSIYVYRIEYTQLTGINAKLMTNQCDKVFFIDSWKKKKTIFSMVTIAKLDNFHKRVVSYLMADLFSKKYINWQFINTLKWSMRKTILLSKIRTWLKNFTDVFFFLIQQFLIKMMETGMNHRNVN